jgi:hypothetical protein
LALLEPARNSSFTALLIRANSEEFKLPTALVRAVNETLLREILSVPLTKSVTVSTPK